VLCALPRLARKTRKSRAFIFIPTFCLCALLTLLLTTGVLLQSAAGTPPPTPAARAAGGFDLQVLGSAAKRHGKFTFNVFVLGAWVKRPRVYLVPDFGFLKKHETVPWVVTAGGTMRSSYIVRDDTNGFSKVRVVHSAKATYFYGISRQVTEDRIVSISMLGGPHENFAFEGPALGLRAPGPFLRRGSGTTVLDLPILGNPYFSYATIVGRPGVYPIQTVSGVKINLQLSTGLRDDQFGTMIPPPVSLDPLRWTARDHLRATAVGIDTAGSQKIQRNNLYAGVLYGFALSLLLPLVTHGRSALRRYGERGRMSQRRRRRARRQRHA
jgi:hypothetical protein